jgi:MFS family permease
VFVFGVLRLVSGVGWGCLTSNTNTLAGELAPPGRQGEVIGHYTMAGSVAFAGSPAVGLFLMNRYGYPATFWTATALTAVALVLSLFLDRRSRVPLGRSSRQLISVNVWGRRGHRLHAMTYRGISLPLLARSALRDPGCSSRSPGR